MRWSVFTVDIRKHYWLVTLSVHFVLRGKEIDLLTKYYLILFSGSLGPPLSLTPKTLSAWEGSCVLISCNFEEEYLSRPINQVSFAWYFEPSFNDTIKDYSGKLLYNSNQTTIAVSSEFRNRVKFVGNLGRKNCSLKISQLRPSDTGVYGIRFYWKSGYLPTQKKWFAQVDITVHGKSFWENCLFPLFLHIFIHTKTFLFKTPPVKLGLGTSNI